MVQFNLLPDIKIQYIKARRQKRIVVLTSVVASAVAVVLLITLGSIVFVIQKKSISDLNQDIKSASSKLQGTADLTKILTVQNQLKALPGLHDSKPVVSRLFDYISQVTPTAANIAQLNADFALNTITISGSADSLETINKFTDTLKFTTYHTDSNKTAEKQAFNDVVLSTFGRDNKAASYKITLGFDPIIFGETDGTTLTVPNTVTTRSKTEQPSQLFKKSETEQP